jgi:hypothetical protein
MCCSIASRSLFALDHTRERRGSDLRFLNSSQVGEPPSCSYRELCDVEHLHRHYLHEVRTYLYFLSLFATLTIPYDDYYVTYACTYCHSSVSIRGTDDINVELDNAEYYCD